MKTCVVVGNPRPGSRTRAAAERVARALTGREPDLVVEVSALGPALLELGNAAVAETVEAVRGCDVVVVASPTFKATYAGVLKLFLDHFPTDALANATAFAAMVGGNAAHALAPELLLKPLLVELGAACPAPGLFLVEGDAATEERLAAWAIKARKALPAVAAAA